MVIQTDHHIFDRKLVRARRDHVASQFSYYNFLKKEAAERLCDRLEDITREFPLALDLGCHSGELSSLLDGRGGIKTLVQSEISHPMLSSATGLRVNADEEFLPFADNSFDLVMSAMSLHWVNDLPGTLVQIRRILKPDGLFLAIMPGIETLRELRGVLIAVESQLNGGASPRISPFVDVRDGGALLQRGGFALPVVDSDSLTITYESMFRLIEDLRGMGETNALAERTRKTMGRTTLMEAAALYEEKYMREDGKIPATVEFVTLTAWKPHDSQQKPARRGSGKVSLTEIF